MGFNDFPCYLGFILPNAMHHTRVKGVDWFEYLESISVNPAHEGLSGSSDILLSTSHKCSKDKMKAVFKWLNSCIDEKGSSYPYQYQKGLLVVLHKDDWELFKKRGFMSDLKNCDERPNETKRLPSDLFCFYVERGNLEKLASSLDSHYSMHYSFGAKCPTRSTKGSPAQAQPEHHHHQPSPSPYNPHQPLPGPPGPHGHAPAPPAPSPQPHHHESHHHHHHQSTSTSTGFNIDLTPFGMGKININTGGSPHPHPAPQPHHHPAPAPVPVPAPSPQPSSRPLPVYVDQNAPHMGFNNFEAFLGFAFSTAAMHHTHVRGIDWFQGIDKKLKPQLHVLPGGKDWVRNDVFVTMLHHCDRREIGNVVNWLHECVTSKLNEYPKHLREGMVLVMLRNDWKIWKSRMGPNDKTLSEKCSDHERDNLGHHYVGRFVPLANLDRFVTALANHYSNNYQVGTKPVVDRPDPNPSSHKKRRHQHHHPQPHHHGHPQPHHGHPQPSPQPYNPHQPLPGPPGPHGHAPAPPAPAPYGQPHPAPQPYNPHAAPAPAPYQPHGAPAPAPYQPHGAPAPQPYGQPHGAPAPQPYGQPHGAPAPQPYGQPGHPAPQPYGQPGHPAPQPYGQPHPAPSPYGAPAPAPYGSAPPPYGGY